MHDWQAQAIEDVWSKVESSERGLTTAEAHKRLKVYGPNRLPEKRPDPAWKLFLNQFRNPLMYTMLGAVVLSIFLGHKEDAIYISIVLLSNVVVGFYQEHKANRSVRALKSLIKVSTRVLRDDMEREIEADLLVPGDLIIFRPGDKVSADARLIESADLMVNESVLTGESRPVEKSPGNLLADTDLSARSNMLYMGTTIEEGSARAVVVETGERTQYGDIVRLLRSTAEEPTRLQHIVYTLSKYIGLIIALVVGLIILEGYLRGLGFSDIFFPALALFVAAVPEGLLPAITIILVIGTRRILKKEGLVRRLASTESLGGVTVICTDKTGTLTLGKMVVREAIVADKIMEPEMMKIVALAGDAFIENPGAPAEKLIVRGNLTEQSLLRWVTLAGFDKGKLEEKHGLVNRILFSSEKKFSAALREDDGGRVLHVVGAPEVILGLSKKLATPDGDKTLKSDEFKELWQRVEDGVRDGQRIVACAYREVKKNQDDANKLLKDLVLVGFISITDPVRKDVPHALEETRRAGIKTIIVTGDNPETARAVAKEIGLNIGPEEAMLGRELDDVPPHDMAKVLGRIKLFSRVSPQHKIRIVRALQKEGEVVAMLGDGVNDAPAIKAAEIGVAVGTEVDAVREVADIVLLNSSFTTIVRAIKEGRIIFDNIRRVFVYLLSDDLSQFVLFFFAIFVGLPLPLLTAQLLLMNIVESGLPDLALTTENDSEGIMDRPPRDPKESLVNGQVLMLMATILVVCGSIAIGFYELVLKLDNIVMVRTMVLVLMCLESLFITYTLRSFHRGLWRKSLFSNWYLNIACLISFVVVLFVVEFAPFQKLFSTVSLPLWAWIFVISANLLEVAIIDRVKLFIFRSKYSRPSSV